MRSVLFVLLVGIVAGGVLLWLAGKDDVSNEELVLPLDDDAPPRAMPQKDVSAEDGSPTAAVPSTRGLPRILPPDAAIEDVRDALALRDATARGEALAAAYGSIGRIAQGAPILRGLQGYAEGVEDDKVRGVSYAAFGANNSGSSHAWLARKLAKGPSLGDRLGALLGLAYDKEGATHRVSTFGGLEVRVGSLPERVDVREALPRIFATLEGDALRDALPVLDASLAAEHGWYAEHRDAIEQLRAKAAK